MSDDTNIIRVHLSNGLSKNVRYDDRTTIKRVISVVLDAVGVDKASFNLFAIRLTQFIIGQSADNTDCLWLHPDCPMNFIENNYLNNPIWSRFELRMRFIPDDLKVLCQAHIEAFCMLHDQVLNDYITQVSWKLPTETVIELASLQIRRMNRSMTLCSVEKYICEDEFKANGKLTRFLPEAVVVSVKTKDLRKQLIAAVKRNISLSPVDCMFRFLSIVLKVAKFDTEIFKASISTGWTVPVEVSIGMRAEISFRVAGRCAASVPYVTILAHLRDIVDIAVKRLDSNSETAVVQLRLTGYSQILAITLPNMQIAESLAHLLDGYQNILSQRGSIWNFKEADNEYITDEIPICSTWPRHQRSSQCFVDYDYLSGHTVEISRAQLSLEELLGGGQFGNVYRGKYFREDESAIPVAIKVCKFDSEPVEKQSFLDEALTMHRFYHPHIIKLIGIRTEPVWIVMELAPLGELRQYLMRNYALIDLSVQLLFCEQISSAIVYLHSCNYVHRDIAARNVLVSSSRSVKLSDFGLSRLIDKDSNYTSNQGKLPIKWMAPESILFRRFNKSTDVWTFGVCMWEILSFGQKPWHGVRNNDVTTCLENGEHLAIPKNCPSSVYSLMLKMWTFEGSLIERPTIQVVNHCLNNFLEQIESDKVPYDQLKLNFEEEQKRQSISSVSASNRNSCYNTVPVVKMDSSLVPSSTIWHTLERQRIQSEEDDKWLEEEEEKLFPLPTISLSRTHEHLSTLSGSRTITNNEFNLPSGLEFDRSSDTIHSTVVKIVLAVSNLSKSYDPEMSKEDFIKLVKDITFELKNLFNESSRYLSALKDEDQQEVQLVETLLGSDMHNLAAVLKAVSINASENNEEWRHEVLKISHRLAFNCKHFLESMDNARLRSQVAKLKLKDNIPSEK